MRNPGFQISNYRFQMSNLDFRYYGSGVAATTSQRPYRTSTGMAGGNRIGSTFFIGSKAKATKELLSTKNTKETKKKPNVFFVSFVSFVDHYSFAGTSRCPRDMRIPKDRSSLRRNVVR